jgi:hypothetical protein
VRLADLGELRPSREQAIIINVGTRLPATLALLSALRHAGMPVLLIDCESKDDSLAYFTALLATHEFDLLTAPLKPHGRTLDWLFANVRCDKLLLVDSDLELHGPDILAFMRQFIDDPRTFGAGFIDEAGWLTGERGFLHNAYYHERPWMPLAMFKVALVREALAQGCSFVDKVVFNDVAGGVLTKVVRRAHESLPLLKRIGVQVPGALRTAYNGFRPELVYYDTGAEVYEHLKFRREQLFVGIPAHFHGRYVTHFFGVSRHVVQGGGTAPAAIADTVIERLRTRYGLTATAP